MSFELHNADCLDVLRGMPDGSVDAVVTDPPYNVGFNYASHDDRMKNYGEWCHEWFAELLRLSRGPILITPGIVNVGMWNGIRKPQWMLCWNKPACMGRSSVGFNNWEPVLLYGKTRGKANCDVFSAPIVPNKDLEGHPCPKPLGWATEQVKRYTAEGDTVLDPFMGSGTTGVACVQTGRKFIGIEIDKHYFGVAKKRIEEAASEGPLFAKSRQPEMFATEDEAHD